MPISSNNKVYLFTFSYFRYQDSCTMLTLFMPPKPITMNLNCEMKNMLIIIDVYAAHRIH